jgi:hypothetical protein
VAGAAALLLEYADLDLQSLKSFLLNSTYDLGYPGHDYKFGRGRLDLARALSFLDAYTPRLGARDLVFETVREPFAGLRLPSYHTCFSDGQTGPEVPFVSLRVLPDYLGATLRTLGLADVNGDGASDLMVSRTRPLDSGAYETEHWLYRGGEPSGFCDRGSICYTHVSQSAEPYEVTALADVNGDGKADVVLQRTEVDQGIETITVSVLLAGETGTLTESNAPWCTVTAYETFRIDMKVGDVNGDGLADLVFSKEYENAQNMYPVFFYTCLSDGERFEPPSYWYVLYLSSYPLGAQGGMSFLDLSDTTRDGFADLVFSCDLAGYKGIYVCPSNGLNGFLSSRLWAGIDLDARVEAIVDVSGDQAADLVFSAADTSSPGRVLRAGLSDGRIRFLTDGGVWFEPNSAGLPSDWTLAGVADVGLGSWQ